MLLKPNRATPQGKKVFNRGTSAQLCAKTRRLIHHFTLMYFFYVVKMSSFYPISLPCIFIGNLLLVNNTKALVYFLAFCTS